jgi:hypothetical protein
MEVLEVAEAAGKGRGSLYLEAFRAGWRQLRGPGGALREGHVFLASLDQDCLAESLFAQGQGLSAVNLWPEVVGTATTPARSVRRLILRPSDAKWWGAEAYREMEDRLEEAEGRRG